MVVTRDHPCPFPDKILEVAAELLPPKKYPRVLDPFAGVGRVHELPNDTVGVELEPEWANHHPDTFVGDATRLSFWAGEFDAVFTSPCYGNRMADSYDGSGDTCGACGGDGREPAKHDGTDCLTCGGSGKSPSRRRTYRIKLGRPLSTNNSGAMQWGADYRMLHRQAWSEVTRVVRLGGRLVINVKNHVRDGQVIPVAEWHLEALMSSARWRIDRIVPVPAPGWTYGQNAELREDFEFVFALTRRQL